MLDPSLIGQILVDNTSLSSEQLEEALRISRETNEFVGHILVNMGYITEKEAAICLGMQWGVAFVDLADIKVDEEAARLIPESLMRKCTCMPVLRTNGRLTVAMADPNNILAIDQIRIHTSFQYEVEPVISTADDILTAIGSLNDHQVRVARELEGILDAFDEPVAEVVDREEGDDIDFLETEAASADPPVVKLVSAIISKAVRQEASDIHIQPEEKEVRVRYRVDGMLRDEMTVPKSAQLPVVSRVKIMANMKIDQKLAPQGGRISLRIGGRAYDFRVSTLPSQAGEKVVLRILDKSSIQVGLNRLGFAPTVQEAFELAVTRPHGIILVTGPTGSGKSTTLYSALQKINTPEKNIITAEDPVEYEVPGLTQCQVNERAGMCFSAILREMLRQDPDVIMVGEVRDHETALLATEAALTGHLVLTTLHTNDSAGAVARLVEMGVEPFLVASAVSCVLAQRLVRKICPKCKTPYHPPREAFEMVGLDPDEHAEVQFFRGVGCEQCHEGYRGRIGVYELLIVDEMVRDMVLQRAASFAVAQYAINQQGMVTLKRDAISKALQGITTLEEAFRVTSVDL